MKYCTQCGKALPDEARYCSACGHPTRTITTTQSTAPSATSTQTVSAQQVPQSPPTRSTVVQQPQYSAAPPQSLRARRTSSQNVSLVFMIISCVVTGLLGGLYLLIGVAAVSGTLIGTGIGTLIPLCWRIPMTAHYHSHTSYGVDSTSTAFKICSLLFTSSIAGILMLCDKD